MKTASSERCGAAEAATAFVAAPTTSDSTTSAQAMRGALAAKGLKYID